jgi:hypothetical protein
MVKEDYQHLAQVVQSVRFQVNEGNFPEDEFDRLIDRMIWAIHASPGGSPDFDHQQFVDRCHGRTPL